MATLKKNNGNDISFDKIASLVPLNSIVGERLHELIKHATLKEVPAKTRLFKKGEIDNLVIYLLEGEIELAAGGERKLLEASSVEAKLAIDPAQPRKSTAIAKTDLVILTIEQNMLDIYLTWDPYSGYVVDEIDAKENNDWDDWMLAILQAELFHRIPPVKIQAMFQKIQHFPVVTDEVIFKQGDKGDYFYFIQKGVCAVIQGGPTGEITVAKLSNGQGFGEEALLSDNPRNATIKMLSDGTLLRLAKEDFEHLFKESIVIAVDINHASKLNSEGAIWLDVRQPEEYAKKSLSNSINIPLQSLRSMLNKVQKEKTYIAYCDTGQRSSCAAYILSSLGYTTYVLEKGVQSLDD